jgi:hypothetical protein
MDFRVLGRRFIPGGACDRVRIVVLNAVVAAGDPACA